MTPEQQRQLDDWEAKSKPGKDAEAAYEAERRVALEIVIAAAQANAESFYMIDSKSRNPGDIFKEDGDKITAAIKILRGR